MEEAVSVFTSVDGFITAANKVKEKLEDDFEKSENAETFLKQGKLGQLMQIVPLYKQLYLDTKVFDRKTLDGKLENAQDENTKNIVHKLFEFEKSINAFLGRIDSDTNQIDSAQTFKELCVNDIFPSDLAVKQVSSATPCNTDASFFFNHHNINHCIVVLLRHFA